MKKIELLHIGLTFALTSLLVSGCHWLNGETSKQEVTIQAAAGDSMLPSFNVTTPGQLYLGQLLFGDGLATSGLTMWGNGTVEGVTANITNPVIGNGDTKIEMMLNGVGTGHIIAIPSGGTRQIAFFTQAFSQGSSIDFKVVGLTTDLGGNHPGHLNFIIHYK